MTHTDQRSCGGTRLRDAATACFLLAAATPLPAQTDYYNTDAGRPLRVEDPYPVERRAFEIQFAPLRLERAQGGAYRWSVEPQVAFGILPGTQVEFGVPLTYVDGATARRGGRVAGADLGILHNLNVETRLPAFGVAADLALAAGTDGGDAALHASVKGIATKTFPWARFHANAQYTFGDAPTARDADVEASRWMGGIAVDRALPLRSLLLAAEVVAEQPLGSDDPLAWSVGTGFRWQRTPRLAVDAGIGRTLTGAERAWYVTFGSAYAVGLPWGGR